MSDGDKVNILLVDDQPAKLLSYEAMLTELGENLLTAGSAQEALAHLLKNEVAVVLVDVCMPELDGFQLAAMIREHPRFEKTAILFISAIHLADDDRLRGYQAGAVDYMPVPVIPDILRAKVKVFIELYRKTRQLETLNEKLEHRVNERTAELAATAARLLASEERHKMALAAGKMGWWDWDAQRGDCIWDEGQCLIFGVDPKSFVVTTDNVRARIHPDDWDRILKTFGEMPASSQSYQTEFRVIRPDGQTRWCFGTAATAFDPEHGLARISGVTLDITERKQAEEYHALLASEVDHRAKNTLAVVQSIVRLTRENSIEAYVGVVEGRIRALSHAHTLLSQSRWLGADMGKLIEEELAPYGGAYAARIASSGPTMSLEPANAQSIALVLHELATNAVKYGALSSKTGKLTLTWSMEKSQLKLDWLEAGGPHVVQPKSSGFGINVIKAIVQGQLGGNVTFTWRKSGLHCTLTIPCRDAATPPVYAPAKLQVEAVAPLASKRVLLVEDEALVAMMIQETLKELGLTTLGPFSRVADALSAARNEVFDAAILDLNLRGEPVYPLAEILAARNVPFIFMTGYGKDHIDRRFAHIPVLHKPVEGDEIAKALRHIRSEKPQPPGSQISQPEILAHSASGGA